MILKPSHTVYVPDNYPTIQAAIDAAAAGSEIRGFTLTNDDAIRGGGILCNEASPTITGNIITLNSTTASSAANGGGIYGGIYTADKPFWNNTVAA